MSLYIEVKQISEHSWRWQIIESSQINICDGEETEETDVVISSGYCQTEDIADQEAQEILNYLLAEPMWEM